ncbi:MAG: chemotaxis protein CheA [Gammaproteobacteria bacterium]|nr:chemotaxis protein CheA [Gammaproteobacteria bacterium]
MSIDLSEFHDVFFEECSEGLDVMESGLLELDHTTDSEDINAIFRAAHSIKGGSASFGFMEISSFTHVMETLLDEIRDGRRDITRDGIDLLLASVDVLRGMVAAARDEQAYDQPVIDEVHQKLESMLVTQTKVDTGIAEQKEDTASETVQICEKANVPREADQRITSWSINFKPDASLLRAGNEPSRIFRELMRLGELTVEADVSAIPPLSEIDPENCYIGWSLSLETSASREEIEELFSWVADESDLEIACAATRQKLPDTDVEPGTGKQAPIVSAETPGEVLVEASADVTPNVQDQPAEKANTSQVTKVAEATKNKSVSSGSGKESGSIRVAIDKVDELINLVGELVITQSMLSQTGVDLANSEAGHFDKLRDGLTQLERNTRELQESVLQIRMLPISFSFSRFPRLVRDLSSKIGKQVELTMTGEQTEVDKTVLEKIGDPLIHLVRNSLDHGIETPEVRKAAGKPETGRLELLAYHEGGDIIIKVIDDGAGLNRENIITKAMEKGLIGETEDLTDERVYNLIFAPGFSTAEQVSDVSGRGVGMDVVRRNVRDLGGNVSINSNDGAGSTVTIRLPLTLAILDGQLARIGEETYIISLVSIVETLQMQKESISSFTGQSELYRLRDEYIPIIRLSELFGTKSGKKNLEDGLLIVVEADGQHHGLFVDELLGQQQVVIKSLESNFTHIQGIAGATILGDGKVALIIDIPGLIQRYSKQCQQNECLLGAVS